LKDSRILVAGGGSGIGKATASLLAESGASVAITGHDSDKLRRVADEMGVVSIDPGQSRYGEIPVKLQTAVEDLGGLDALINNAGIGVSAPLGN
jgi:NADP-dependent 3-hydroxy acid dehydrogenase YdfG